ncbi:MAG TPA: hypothetical protein VK666_05015 [Chryseolinea sp.]|nr:hypothetical protein [Chryseolinea sp.]
MNLRKGVLLFGISVLVTACFNPPEFSISPVIDYVGIYFKEGTAANPTDSLILTISFKDGDGDLGLSPTQIDDPYHDVFYGLADNGTVTEVAKETRYSNLPQFVKLPPGAKGKLVTTRTLQDPQYADDLPPFVDEFTSCTDYKLQTVYVSEEDSHIIDNTYQEIDTLIETGFPKVFIVQDVFYKKNNPKHDNIEVEFWVKGPGNEYTLFDWEKEYCETAFNQRFPVLSEKEQPLEGNLEYAMTSLGIKANFSIKTLKLRIRIRDRAFNTSNDVETGDFTLDKIKR